MVAASEIGWGSYRSYEGPYYKGKHRYTLPGGPTENDRIIAVITATEGGAYDAFNGYDGCGWTSGLIQWIEKGQYSVSDMLGAVAASHPALLSPVHAQGENTGYRFQKCGNQYRFCKGGALWVDTLDEQLELFYMGGTGKKGTWSDAAKTYAKEWAAAISTVWENTQAQFVQVSYTAKRLNGFMMPTAAALFKTMPDTPVARAFRSAYLSFAANNPTRAQDAIRSILNITTKPAWSKDWVVQMLQALTFQSGVAIYPHRYECIRPVLEKLYGVDLPDFAKELKDWSQLTGIPGGVDTTKVQKALLALGYDLGPRKADGVYGDKTRTAVLELERNSGTVPVECQDGMVDVYTWPAMQKALADKGLEFSFD